MSYLGNLIIVSAPSGGGKTSLVKKVTSTLKNIEVSISHTTRQSRPGEEHGVHYFFVTPQEFLTMVKQKAFIEYAQVFDHYYGTSIAQIEARLEEGIDVILDIDWQGAEQIKHLFPEAISVFIVPPSLDVLKQRLLNRRQDNMEIVKHRMRHAQDELRHFSEFDYIIINDAFDKAAVELEAIIISNRLQTKRQARKHQGLLSFLLASK
ncbi:MAG: guanylate kinase [Legionella sp.]|nr:guanylate kinase [Legionella sp.]